MAAKDTKRGRGDIGPASRLSEYRKKEKRGEEAEKLLNNETLKEAFETMQENAIKKIRESDLNDGGLREELYRFYKNIDLVQAELKIYLTQGKNASTRLTEVLKHVS